MTDTNKNLIFLIHLADCHHHDNRGVLDERGVFVIGMYGGAERQQGTVH